MQDKPPPAFYLYARVFHADQWDLFMKKCREIALQGCGAAQKPACDYVAKVERSLPSPVGGYDGDLTYIERAEFNITDVLGDHEFTPGKVLPAKMPIIMNTVTKKFKELYNSPDEMDTLRQFPNSLTSLTSLNSSNSSKRSREKLQELQQERAHLKTKIGMTDRLLHRTVGEAGMNVGISTTMGKIVNIERQIANEELALVQEMKKAESKGDSTRKVTTDRLVDDIGEFWDNATAIEYRDPGKFHWLYKASLGRVPDSDCKFTENLENGGLCGSSSYIVQFITTSSPFPPLADGKVHVEGRVAYDTVQKAVAECKGAHDGGALYVACENYHAFMKRIYYTRNALTLATVRGGPQGINYDYNQTLLDKKIDVVKKAIDELLEAISKAEQDILNARQHYREGVKGIADAAKKEADMLQLEADQLKVKARIAQKQVKEATKDVSPFL